MAQTPARGTRASFVRLDLACALAQGKAAAVQPRGCSALGPLLYDDIECVRFEGEIFDIAFMPVDLHHCRVRVFARFREEFRRQIEARDFRAKSGRHDSDDARSASDVEYALSRTDARMLNKPCRGSGGQRLKRREIRPSCSLCVLEGCKWVAG